ncbi:isocitrate lyase/PEP mutase family protein [Hydrogenophaga sp. BPS33]|uniref:isocitrate lyase/PEP mutase family protein n=1 Tax=Hydrogenophaga sp. BPS33 TaxID=2651974 RepID=UPI00135B6ABD|nr:isocitrate lyase/PEP mutase family protein [Hydrogenophaga sp. BPS33]
MSTSASRLRALLKEPGILAVPGAHDGVSARIAEQAGFSAVYLGGNALGISLAVGQPLLTLTETADCSTRIVRTTPCPLIVDAGAGFGSVAQVHRTVREIESTGAAALHIDDQPYPKSVDYHRGKGGLVDLSEAAARIEVAVKARQHPDFMVIARTDVYRATGDVEQLARRCKAYAQAGADALLLLDVEDPAHLQRVRQDVPDLPLMWIGGVVPPVLSLQQLEKAGFAAALYPFNAIAAVVQSLTDLWAGLRESGRIDQADDFLLRMRGGMSRLAGMQTYWDIEDALRDRRPLGSPQSLQ